MVTHQCESVEEDGVEEECHYEWGGKAFRLVSFADFRFIRGRWTQVNYFEK
jgi:hypothetical protein